MHQSLAGYLYSKNFFELIKDGANLKKLEKLSAAGLLHLDSYDNGLDKVAALDDKTIDALSKSGEDLRAKPELLKELGNLSDSDLAEYRKIRDSLDNVFPSDGQIIIGYIQKSKDIPEAGMKIIDRLRDAGLYDRFSAEAFCKPLNDALERKGQFSELIEFSQNDPDADRILNYLIEKNKGHDLGKVCWNLMEFKKDPKNYFLGRSYRKEEIMANYDEIQGILKDHGGEFSGEELKNIIFTSFPEKFFTDYDKFKKLLADNGAELSKKFAE